MKERPILFSAPMVRALFDGSKTQTRRVLKQATGLSLSVDMHDIEPAKAVLSWLIGDGPGYPVMEQVKVINCPYGQPGDQLWVREAWRYGKEFDDWKPSDMPKEVGMWFEASGSAPSWMGKLRPSIHMPRWASRINLEITGVRVERLHACNEMDARAEGVGYDTDGWFDYMMPGTQCCTSPRASYQTLWESINGAGSWEANPWVWVVEFKRITA